MQMFWTFNLNFDVDILAFFVLQQFWLLFPKIGLFFPIIWLHWLEASLSGASEV
jgi:hypothetical protein